MREALLRCSNTAPFITRVRGDICSTPWTAAGIFDASGECCQTGLSTAAMLRSYCETTTSMYRAALGGAPMAVGGGAGAVHYAEVKVLALGMGALIGVGRPGLDVGREDANITAEFWGVDIGDGLLGHAGQWTTWAGSQRARFKQGDTLGLLLDGGAGTLSIFQNAVRLGIMVKGLTGELCWAAALGDERDSARLTAKPPPAGWRESVGKAEPETEEEDDY